MWHNAVSHYLYCEVRRYVICYIFSVYISYKTSSSIKVSIAEVLRKRYGDRILKLVRKFEKTNVKHKKTLLDLQFLKICEDHNVIPNFWRFEVTNASLRTSFIYKRFQKKLLREEIYNKKLLVRQLDRDSNLAYKNVKSDLNIIDFHHVLNISLMSNEKELGRIKFRNLSKMKNLIPNFSWDMVVTSSHDQKKVIFLWTNF